jgi:polysaccharide pyruvyl transferase CsaB
MVSKKSLRNKVLIAGYYGFGNAGDEAILESMLADLLMQQENLEFVVVSANPIETMSNYHVKAVYWKDIIGLLNAVRESDLVILGGGGLFHDYWGVPGDTLLTQHHWGIPYYSGFGLLAALYRKPFMIYSVGIGPLLLDEGKRLTRLTFDLADAITVRDLESKEWLVSVGFPENKVLVTADPALNLSSDANQAEEILRSDGIIPGEQSIIGICIRNWTAGEKDNKWKMELATAIDQFIDIYDAQVVFIPFQVSDRSMENDHIAALGVVGMMRHHDRVHVLPKAYPPDIVSGLISRCHLVIGMRLHSLIFSTSAAIPAVALVYDPKVSSYMGSLGLSEYALDLQTVDADQLFNTIKYAWTQQKQIQKKLTLRKKKLKDLARKSTSLALELLEKGADEKVTGSVIDGIRYLALKQTFALAERDQAAQVLSAQVLERDLTVQVLRAQALERDQTVQVLSAQVLERDQTVQVLRAKVLERDQTVQVLSAQVLERDQTVQVLRAKVLERDQTVQVLRAKVLERDQAVQSLSAQVLDRDQAAKVLRAKVLERDQAVQSLSAQVLDRDQAAKVLREEVLDRDQAAQVLKSQIQALQSQVEHQNAELLEIQQHLKEILNSKAWKLVQIFRGIRTFVLPIGSRREKLARSIYRHQRTLSYTVSKNAALIRQSIHRHGLPLAILKGLRIIVIRLYNMNKHIFHHDKYIQELNQLDLIISKHQGFFDIFHVPMGWNTASFQRFQHISLQSSRLGGLALYGGHPIVDHGIIVYQKVAKNLYVFDATNREVVERIFQALEKKQQPRILRIQSIDLVTTYEDVIDFIQRGFTVVYEYIDQISSDITGNVPDLVFRRHEALLKDERVLVVATSDQLFEEVKQLRLTNFVLSTNGVDPEHWRKAKGKPPEDLFPVLNGNTIIGYHGALAKWIDYELLHAIADKGCYQLLLIGYEHDEEFSKSGLKEHSRVHFLGSKSYFVLNSYIPYYDVAILPFMKTKLTDSVSPVKIFEYMAALKPIVTTDLRECKKYKSCLVARNMEEFMSQLERATKLKDDPAFLRILDAEAKENSWQQKTTEILRLAGVDI